MLGVRQTIRSIASKLPLVTSNLPVMRLLRRLALFGLFPFLAASIALHSATPEKVELPEWKDTKGNAFRAEPVDAMGPFAMFRASPTSSRLLLMRGLSPEDRLRFYQAVRNHPPRAAHWGEATGQASREFIGRTMQLKNHRLEPLDLSATAEPELLIVVFGPRVSDERQSGSGSSRSRRQNSNVRGSWRAVEDLAPFASRVERVYPGRVATVVMNVGSAEARTLPLRQTWLVVDPKQQASMPLMSQFASTAGFIVTLMTRDGVLLIGAPANDSAEIMKFVDHASDLLWQLNPANPRTWRDRAEYLGMVRPLEFAQGKTGALLLAEPLNVDVLRERGIKQVNAQFDVDAAGSVTRVGILSTSDVLPALAAPLAAALRRSAKFLPAVENGAAVASTYDYSLNATPPDPQAAADAAWVNGEARVDIPLKDWLVLKPIPVPQQVFSTIDHVGEDGVVMLKAVKAGKSDPSKVSTLSQLNSFNHDWFADDGAATVRPVAGAKQEVDGEKLRWERMRAENGLVDLARDAGKVDYSIGYAWTEFEAPEDMQAWLGLGSDDGVRVWLNGEVVDDKWIARTSRLDDDVVAVRLHKGKNTILIKIQNVTGQWSFTSRLRGRG
jgi:hypothetical protein